MLLRPTERTVVMIDGANNAAALKAIAAISGDQLDLSLFIKALRVNCTLVHAMYYTALFEDKANDPVQGLITYLKNNGYSIRSKLARRYGEGMNTRIKGNMDVEIACDMLTYSRNGMQHIILFSGDNDFTYAVNTAQLHGARVTVVSTRASSPRIAGDELVATADDFVDLKDLSAIYRRV